MLLNSVDLNQILRLIFLLPFCLAKILKDSYIVGVSEDAIGLDDIAKEIFPVEVMGLGDGLPTGGSLDDAVVVDIPDKESIGVFGVGALNENFEVVAGGYCFDGIPGLC